MYEGIPKDLTEAVDELWKVTTIDEKKKMQECDEDEGIARVHNTAGRALRNKWKLWDFNSPLSLFFQGLGIQHADDMFGIIMSTFIRSIKGQAVKVIEQVAYYRHYWEKLGQDPDNLIKK